MSAPLSVRDADARGAFGAEPEHRCDRCGAVDCDAPMCALAARCDAEAPLALVQFLRGVSMDVLADRLAQAPGAEADLPAMPWERSYDPALDAATARQWARVVRVGGDLLDRAAGGAW